MNLHAPTTASTASSPEGEAARRLFMADVKGSSQDGSAFAREWQVYCTNQLWARTWSRGVLSRPQLSLVTLGVLAGKEHFEEFERQIRVALDIARVPTDHLQEALLHIGLYCGVLTGDRVFAIASDALRARDMTTAHSPPVQTQVEAKGNAGFDALGVSVRRRLFGDSRFDQTMSQLTAFDREYELFITNQIFGRTWGRGIVCDRDLSLLTLGILAGLDRMREFELHFRVALNATKVPLEHLRELLMHIALYCGIAVASNIFFIARTVLKAEGVDLGCLEEPVT